MLVLALAELIPNVSVSVQRDWIDIVALSLTGALLIVGIFGVIFAARTLRVLGKQTTAIQQQGQSMINAERAWVMAELSWTYRAMHLVTHSTTTSVNVLLSCKNHGSTPAWITEISIRMEVTSAGPSRQPDLQGAEVFYGPHPLAPNDKPFSKSWSLNAQGLQSQLHQVLIYGVVKYRDVLTGPEQIRETWFGYRVVGIHSLERLSHPEYNKAL